MGRSLTVFEINSIKATDKRQEIPDEGIPGLYLVVQPSGAKSWALRYRHDGQSRKYTVGPYSDQTITEMRKAAKRIIGEIAIGRDPAAKKRTAREEAKEARKHDVAGVVDEFIRKHADKKLRTRSRDEIARILRHDLVAEHGSAPVSSITRRNVRDIVDAIVDRGSPVMANRTLAAMQRFFRWCVEQDRIAISPAEGISPPAVEAPRERVLTDDELRIVMLAADAIGWPFGPAVKLLALTGQRLAEVSEASWDEFDLDRAEWVLPAARAKNGKIHTIPLAPEVIEIIKALPRGESEFLFSTTVSTPISGWSRAKRNLDAATVKIMRAEAVARGDDPAEIEALPAWRIHDLRRTCASGMAALGVPVHVAEKVLNHTSGTFAGIVSVYQKHAFSDEKRNALAAWAKHVAAIIKGRPEADNVISIRKA